ncbi:patatin-like phospholipase family protein [Mesorhizobium sp.]|uniref:patatin-like phospholipase family protein n=1 Tax=Mesorhizobium sp. TaxID=1871066 RepID=UPI000FE9663C|nr:patatin-like phospholipase family protein [Mesorhizobium sp.]RWO49219.1 MAG: patatin [Mesorhizobium sp.]
MAKKAAKTKPFRILSLDGGGAKGFYTLGVLKELEAAIGPLHKHFDLIYGTSTGSIIGTLLAIGEPVEKVHALYQEHVPSVMKRWLPSSKSARLKELADEIFQGKKFDAVQTGIGIVAAKWIDHEPMIFKADVRAAHGRQKTFVPGWACTLADAVQASCSAYPFFCLKTVKLGNGDTVKLADGGYCANNPSLYAIADATRAYLVERSDIRLLSVGVGVYPTPIKSLASPMRYISMFPSVRLLQRVLEINTQSMDRLRSILFGDLNAVRVSGKYHEPEMATDLVEHDLMKLSRLHQKGRTSFGDQEQEILKLLA